MGHYAKIINGKVVKVIVATYDFIQNYKDDEPEFIDYPSKWVKTSYNTRGGIHYQPNTDIPSEDQSKSLRKNYAGIGFTYDEVRDAFIPLKPFDSWVLNETSCLWEAPVAYPEDGGLYRWDEETQTWNLLSL